LDRAAKQDHREKISKNIDVDNVKPSVRPCPSTKNMEVSSHYATPKASATSAHKFHSTVIIGAGMSGRETAKHLLATRAETTITFIEANKFYEADVTAPFALANKEYYHSNLSSPQHNLQIEGCTYVNGIVTAIERTGDSFVVIVGGHDDIVADCVVVATSFAHPLTKPAVGVTWSERLEELDSFRKAIAEADNVLVAGGGIVGCEVAGNVRDMLLKQSAKVIHVASGKQLLTDQFSSRERKMLTDYAKNLDRLELVLEDRVDGQSEAKVEKNASYQLKSGKTVIADVFIPSFASFRTSFLPEEAVNHKGEVKVDKKNLMSVAMPNMFAVGCNDNGEMCAIPKINNQAVTVAKNIANIVKGTGETFVHKEGMPVIQAELVALYGKGYGQINNDESKWLGQLCFACGFPFPCCLAPCVPMCGLCGFICSRSKGGNVPAFFEALFKKGPWGPVLEKAKAKPAEDVPPGWEVEREMER